MVPDDMEAYKKAMNDFSNDGGVNPALKWKFVKKEVAVASTTEIMWVSADEAAKVIPTQAPASYGIAYLKVVDGTAYTLLAISLDGWAGVSRSIAAIQPLVENTLLQFGEVKSVKFELAPGDKIEDVRKAYVK